MTHFRKQETPQARRPGARVSWTPSLGGYITTRQRHYKIKRLCIARRGVQMEELVKKKCLPSRCGLRHQQNVDIVACNTILSTLPPPEDFPMGKTLPPFSQLIDAERRRWAPFKRALPKAD